MTIEYHKNANVNRKILDLSVKDFFTAVQKYNSVNFYLRRIVFYKNGYTSVMEKKKNCGQTEETELEDVVSVNECTGLMQGMPLDEADKENYGELYDYGPEANSDEIEHADRHVVRKSDIKK